MSFSFQPSHFPVIQGHRGAPLLGPENSVNAFQRAAEVGAESIELDVFLSKDDNLVVFHGGKSASNPKEVGSLSGHTTSEKNIQDLSLDEIRALTFKTDSFACPTKSMEGFYIPTLKEVLEDVVVENNMHVTIELKGSTTAKPVVQLLHTLRKKLDLKNQVTISSFNHNLLAQIKELDQTINVATLFGKSIPDYAAVARQYHASEVHLSYKLVTKDIVDSLHQAGYIVMAWFSTPGSMEPGEEESHYLRLIQSGVDVICTNEPDTLVKKKPELLNQLQLLDNHTIHKL